MKLHILYCRYKGDNLVVKGFLKGSMLGTSKFDKLDS